MKSFCIFFNRLRTYATYAITWKLLQFCAKTSSIFMSLLATSRNFYKKTFGIILKFSPNLQLHLFFLERMHYYAISWKLLQFSVKISSIFMLLLTTSRNLYKRTSETILIFLPIVWNLNQNSNNILDSSNTSSNFR